MIELAKFTGWQPEAIGGLDIEEFWQFHQEAVGLHNELNTPEEQEQNG